MKKFLSLVLALVMTLSLVTISAGAKDFTDDESIQYDEAIDVMSAIGVIDGYTDGSFNPQGTLSRGAAAKIIYNPILAPPPLPLCMLAPLPCRLCLHEDAAGRSVHWPECRPEDRALRHQVRDP